MTHHYTRYVGIDIHKKNATWVIVDPRGQKLLQGKLPMEGLKRWASTELHKTDQVVIEATGNSYYVYDQLSPLVGEVVLAHALAMHDRTKARRKTDRVDALCLAQALASGYVATVWVPSVADRQKREWVSHRHALMEHRTSLRNQLRSLLYRYGLEFKGDDILDPRALSFVQEASLPDLTKTLFASKWRIGQSIQSEIQQWDQQGSAVCAQDETSLKLLTLPGIGTQAAMILTSAIGEIQRFDSPKKLASYAGLVPSVHISDETVRYGRITKQGRSLLRWIMVEAAHAAVQTPGPIRDRYQRLIRKGKSCNVATVAIARHLLELVWHLLTNNQVFRGVRPKYLTVKLRGLLRKAYGRCPNGAAPTLVYSLIGRKV